MLATLERSDLCAKSFLNLRNYFGEKTKRPSKISSAFNIEIRGEGANLEDLLKEFLESLKFFSFSSLFFTCEIISVNSRAEMFAE